MGKITKMDIVLKDVTVRECLILNSLLRDSVSRIQRKRKRDDWEVGYYDIYLKFSEIFFEYVKLFANKETINSRKVKNVSNKIPISKKVIL